MLSAMDSMGLVTSATNHWTKAYGSLEDDQEPAVQLYSIEWVRQHFKTTLSSGTASSWLVKLGCNWKNVWKAVYKDGHERPDVYEYRQNIYLPRMAALQSQMMEWTENLQPITRS